MGTTQPLNYKIEWESAAMCVTKRVAAQNRDLMCIGFSANSSGEKKIAFLRALRVLQSRLA
jgi:hypothetical protein